jgi:hypothetical protein
LTFSVLQSHVHLTSFDVKGLPSCHVTPWRSFMVSLVLLASQAQLSASSGRITSGRLIGSAWSKMTRLLNTAMKGWVVALVASSRMDALGGLATS